MSFEKSSHWFICQSFVFFSIWYTMLISTWLSWALCLSSIFNIHLVWFWTAIRDKMVYWPWERAFNKIARINDLRDALSVGAELCCGDTPTISNSPKICTNLQTHSNTVKLIWLWIMSVFSVSVAKCTCTKFTLLILAFCCGHRCYFAYVSELILSVD